MLNLEAHLEGRDGLDLLRRTLMALFLLQILRHAGYFKGINITGVESLRRKLIFIKIQFLKWF